MTPIRGFLFAVLLLVPFCARAQTEPVTMAPEVVVSADRFPTPAGKVTGSVTVVTNEEMQRNQWRTVQEVLRYVPGVSVQQSGGPGTLTSVFVRGANSNQTLVLIDGINVSDPASGNGAVDFAHFLTENLDRVEIVRGPMSTLYGSQAIGGVINMVTKAGKGPMNGGAFTELGTRLQTNSGGYLRGSEGRFNYNFTLAGTYAPGETIVPGRFTPPGGYVDLDGYRNVTAASRVGMEIDDRTNLTWFGRYIDTQVKFDQVGQEDPNAGEFSQQFFNRLELDGSYFDGRWKPVFGLSYTSIYRHFQDFPSLQNPTPFVQDAYYNGRRLQADWKNQIGITEQFDLVAGIDYDRAWAYSNSDGTQSWGTMAQTGFYGQLRGTFVRDLTVTLGGRIDVNDVYGTVSTWRAGATYLFRDTDTRFKGSYGTAFKAPSLFQLYGAGLFCGGNPTLQPEYNRGYEFGVEQGLYDKKVSVGITYFYNAYSNLVQCPPPFTALQNIANAQSEGVEVFLKMQPFDWLDLNLDYTYMNARTAQNTPLVRRPQDSFSLRAEVRPWDGVRFGMGLSQVSNRYDFSVTAFQPTIVQPSNYTLLRFTAAYEVRKNVELFARVENALNQSYEEPEGFQAPYIQAFFGLKGKF